MNEIEALKRELDGYRWGGLLERAKEVEAELKRRGVEVETAVAPPAPEAAVAAPAPETAVPAPAPETAVQ